LAFTALNAKESARPIARAPEQVDGDRL